MSTIIYGIPNCDTVKKARRWLEAQHIDYHFHDFRADGIDAEMLKHWLATLGWETLVNRRSSTWKALDAAARGAMNDDSAAPQIMAAPTLIKRPLLDHGGQLEVGFSEARYRQIFAADTDTGTQDGHGRGAA